MLYNAGASKKNFHFQNGHILKMRRHTSGERKLVQLVWKALLAVSTKVRTNRPQDPVPFFLGIFPVIMNAYDYKKMCTRMLKQHTQWLSGVKGKQYYAHNGILYANEKERATATHSNRDDS